MESISVFDILKIGIGPSSSHTMGPWKAVQICLREYAQFSSLDRVRSVHVHLFGSLAKTGTGHGTNKAIMLGLMGYSPVTVDCHKIDQYINDVIETGQIRIPNIEPIPFKQEEHIVFRTSEQLPFHSNGLKIIINQNGEDAFEETYYSIGGGFVVKGEGEKAPYAELPCPIEYAQDLQRWCDEHKCTVSEVVFNNELTWRTEDEIKDQLDLIMETMVESVYRGCHSTGILPGGLTVKRRASFQNKKLISSNSYDSIGQWIELIKEGDHSFTETLNWVSCFALAVNEENAAFGRVVTAPTNGAAGVMPAVMLYYSCFCEDASRERLHDFLLVAGELGSIFKKGATISAAMGGCQAEIGVSSAMAAGALTEVQGGTPEEVLMAAEIAMEHHLGLTCDPIGGLVQVPCIERNAMGAMKAITASQIALASDPHFARVSLDDVIKTMWQTAEDMNSKYKETSEGGLAVNIPVSFPDC